MTLIVGIRCTDGVVIAADSAVTFGPSTNLATMSDRAEKISIIKDAVIVAGTGQVGLGQRFTEIVGQHWAGQKLGKGCTKLDIGRRLSTAGIEDLAQTHGKLGQYGALVAITCDHSDELIEFAVQDFQPEAKDSRIWYAAIGSGQLLADPYLRLVRTLFWQDGPPRLASGKFVAMWVMKHAIAAAPGGIAEPIHMATLHKGKATKVSEEELAEHEGSVQALTEHIRAFRRESTSGDAPSAPSPGA